MTVLLYDLVGSDPTRPFSPHCWKVAFALAHKGLAFERVPTRFTAVAGVEGGRHKTVPVIREGERTVGDSFDIALDLERRYPDRPTLFGGPGGEASARFIERWALVTLHPFLAQAALMDIHERLLPDDQAHFRKTREARFGMRLEEIPLRRHERRPAFRASLEPLRATLTFQPFLGGDTPLFADYIVAGAFQWVRVISDYEFLAADDPLQAWLDRCLDLHDGLGRSVPAAA
jgi:glutathione S-transferase